LKSILLCPDCNRAIKTSVTPNGNSHKTYHSCSNAKCHVMEIKYGYTTNVYGERFVKVKSVKREATARPQPLYWLTPEMLKDNSMICNMSNKELQEKGYFE